MLAIRVSSKLGNGVTSSNPLLDTPRIVILKARRCRPSGPNASSAASNRMAAAVAGLVARERGYYDQVAIIGERAANAGKQVIAVDCRKRARRRRVPAQLGFAGHFVDVLSAWAARTHK